MTTLHVQVVLPARTGMARDAAINTFTFTAAVPAEDLVAAIDPVLDDFYNNVGGSGFCVANYIGPSRTRTADECLRRYFDVTAHLNGSAAGPPVAETTWTLAASTSSDELPEEVALVLSFHGTDATIPEFGPGTRPRSRHRGRVYLGPLIEGAISSPAPTYACRPTSGIQITWADAGALMRDAAVGWSVWSRRNAATYPVVDGWVDDAFDTQRRRGPDPTAKFPWVPPV